MLYAALCPKTFHISSRLQSAPSYPTFLFSPGLKLLVYGLLVLVLTSSAFAGPVRLAWDPPISAPNLAGYMLYYGSASGSYSAGVDVGNFTTAAVSSLQDGSTYYFVTTAYDAYGKESSFSNEVSYTIPEANDAPPTVTLISPLDGASVARKSTVTISATAWDDVGMSKVEFYVNGSLTCTDVTASFTCAWKVPNSPGRTYQLQAKVYDTSGKVGTSSIITVIAQ